MPTLHLAQSQRVRCTTSTPSHEPVSRFQTVRKGRPGVAIHSGPGTASHWPALSCEVQRCTRKEAPPMPREIFPVIHPRHSPGRVSFSFPAATCPTGASHKPQELGACGCPLGYPTPPLDTRTDKNFTTRCIGELALEVEAQHTTTPSPLG
ncbi:hypothetical protein LZ30DRAFT_398442 [Colletotrichum cereale]|nr:hypothetical protein LZ30DRAFT_398442 [Colletotrichum cereale]